MRLALMIIGLALAAVMGLQSFSVMTHPFANAAISGAGSTGVLAAFIAIVGAAFSLQYPLAAIVGFGLAALLAIMTSLNSPFDDLGVWGAGFVILTGLTTFLHFRNTESGASQQSSAPRSATPFAPAPPASRPLSHAGNAPPAVEADLFDQLERLGQLRASGALDEQEFASMKARLLNRSQPTSGGRS